MEESKRVTCSFALSDLICDIKNHLGLIIVAEAGHGKSYTAFTIVKEAMKDKDTTVMVFSPSTIWKRNFGAINMVSVGTSAFNPVVEDESVKIESIPTMRDSIFVNLDTKWLYDNRKGLWLEELLQSKQHLLFEIKYLNGRRIKKFESMILQYIFSMQELEITKNPQYKHHYIMVFEEVQNSFGTYSMNDDESSVLLSILTKSRTDANIHYIAIGQRLNDISTKVVERLRPLIGKTLGENSLRKLRTMLPKDLRVRIQTLPERTWIYLDGKENPELTIPTYEKEGEPTMLKPIPEPKKKPILERIVERVASIIKR